ncbi:PAS domain S-box protein [Siccirubricoccus sp. KC 17139]|uniref:histidine kinase n=1 Tax=Siccirubricoccus soli TaxID=2899147 RepID=A0ABT1D0A2_9PROT|nr:HWE histidine kinase domain-containing protein [Siccirubricoccus soli]MCO6415324.1 PAS domain S-box protein [Siccirubricoccus soli]MCP2681456.1 PAS domain S-box protein [Siccirubricoccus soli]
MPWTMAWPKPPPSAAQAAPRRDWTLLHAVLLGSVLLPTLGMAALAWAGWHAAQADAQRELERSALASAEYANRVIEAQRFAGLSANEKLRGLSDAAIRAREAELHAALASILAQTELVQSIHVTDRQGRPLVSATLFPVPPEGDMAARDPAWPAPNPEQHGPVDIRRADGALFYALSLRRTGGGNGLPEGAFDGAISVVINPNQVAAGFTALDRAGDITALVRQDGEVLVRTPVLATPIPRIPAASPLHGYMREGARSGSYVGLTLGFNEPAGRWERLVAFHRIGTLPLYVTVGRPLGLIAAAWRDRLLLQLAVAGPFALLLVGLAWLALRRTQAAAAAEAALQREMVERQAAERARAAESRFRGVFESRVIGMAIFDWATGEVEAVNDRLREMTGQPRGTTPWHLRMRTPPEYAAADLHAIEEARQRGWWRPYEKEYERADGTRLPVRIASAPLPGEPHRVVVTVQDITEQREAEARRDLLLGEINHRAKNVLATAQAALRLSRAGTVAEHIRDVDGRIGALAHAMALLSASGWQSADLEELVRATLAPFLLPGHDGPLCRIEGPPVALASNAVQPLSMALHELATNAAKYGALSVRSGELSITWSVSPAGLRLNWQERGGPVVSAAPKTHGFGTRVMEATIRRQLGGSLVQEWLPEGLLCRIELSAGRGLAQPAPVAEVAAA